MSQKLYFSELDGMEFANTIDEWRDRMKFHNIEIMEIYRARADRSSGYFWCKEYSEVGESKESCGKQCPRYTPRNGKSGICKHNGPCYLPYKSEKVILII